VVRKKQRKPGPALELMLQLWRTGYFRNRSELARVMQEKGRGVTRQRVAALARRAHQLGLLREDELPAMPSMARSHTYRGGIKRVG